MQGTGQMKKMKLIFGEIIALMALVPIFGCAQMAAEKNAAQYDTVTVIDNLVIDENSVPIFPKRRH